MSRTKIVGGGIAVVVLAGLGIAWASGDWSSARSKTDEFKSRQQDLRKLEPDETRQSVTAICEVEEEARRDAGRDGTLRFLIHASAAIQRWAVRIQRETDESRSTATPRGADRFVR